MARLVKIEANAPIPIECGTEKKWICACGLTKNFPYCDGSHHKTDGEKPGKTYRYVGDERVELP